MTGSEEVVRQFLEALEAGDVERAVAFVAEDIEYTNVPMPPLRGRQRLDKAFRSFTDRAGFRVHFHNVASDGGTVLTERTDAILLGRVHWQFWVYGRFEVVDGQITVWRDSFDFADLLVGLVRGVLGLRWPAAARRWPTD